MPCATIHMLTAGRVLGEWRRRPDAAPFQVGRAHLRRAFLLGAMGPDMGFVPGIDRFVSELSHYVSTGSLTRALLEEAEDPAEVAFAWGWATHHRTDVEVHPLVGRACGEHLLGDRSVRLNSSEDCETHVAMEVGLDLVFLGRDDSIPAPPAEPLARRDAMGFLARALERTYGISWDSRKLHSGHVAAAARTARWPRLLRLLARARRFQPASFEPGLLPVTLGPLVGAARRALPSSGAIAGFLGPLRPPRWLVEEVAELAEAFPGRFERLVQGGMSDLEDRNLETGMLEHAPQEHPDSERTVSRLRELLRASGRPTKRIRSRASEPGPGDP